MNQLSGLLTLVEATQTEDGHDYLVDVQLFDVAALRTELAAHATELRAWSRDIEQVPEFSTPIEILAVADYLDPPV